MKFKNNVNKISYHKHAILLDKEIKKKKQKLFLLLIPPRLVNVSIHKAYEILYFKMQRI